MKSNTRNEATKKAWVTRRSPTYKASKTERESKKALASWCKASGWKILFFEGKSGAPRTGIVDAIMARIKPEDSDAIEIKFVQLKSGTGGLTAFEIARMKKAIGRASKDWLLAAYDGEILHFLPEIPMRSR